MGCENDGALRYLGVKYIQRGYQMDDSFLKELNKSSKRRNKRKLYLLVLALLFIPVVVFGSYKGVNAIIGQRNKPKNVILINKPDTTSTEVENKITPPNNSPQPVTTLTPSSTPTSSSNTITDDAMRAELCADNKKNALDIHNSNNEIYTRFMDDLLKSDYSIEAIKESSKLYGELYMKDYRDNVNSHRARLESCGISPESLLVPLI